MTAYIHGFPFGDTVIAPSSKSELQRAIICAAFSERLTEISCNNYCDDVKATVNAVESLGAVTKSGGDYIAVFPIRTIPEAADFDCIESGATLRFMLSICSALGINATLYGTENLIKRPNEELEKTLRDCGVEIEKAKKYIKISGKINKNPIINAEISSQYISGLLLADAVGFNKFDIRIEGKRVSSGYIDITKNVLKQFGIKTEDNGSTLKISGMPHSPNIYKTEGDWSAAVYYAVAAVLAKKTVTIKNINTASLQPDGIITEILKKTGIKTAFDGQNLTVFGNKPRSFNFDADGSPDIVPALVALACGCDGKTEISGVSRLKYKESNRIESLCSAFSSIGADIRYENERLVIIGKEKLSGIECDSFNDHRIAMAITSVCPICERGLIIKGFECVSKSYPNFAHEIKNGVFA